MKKNLSDLIKTLISEEDAMLGNEIFGGNIVKQENHKGALRILHYLEAEIANGPQVLEGADTILRLKYAIDGIRTAIELEPNPTELMKEIHKLCVAAQVFPDIIK